MRVFTLLLLALCAAGAAHAQLTLGPKGIRPEPINVFKLYRFLKNVYGTIAGEAVQAKAETEEDSETTTPSLYEEGRREGGVDTSVGKTQPSAEETTAMSVLLKPGHGSPNQTQKDYDSAVLSIKSRIEEASKSSENSQDSDVAVSRIVSLPSFNVFAFGKWPVVYIVLNSLLLLAAVILAKPYFFTGETILTKFEEEMLKKKEAEQRIYDTMSDNTRNDEWGLQPSDSAPAVRTTLSSPSSPVMNGLGYPPARWSDSPKNYNGQRKAWQDMEVTSSHGTAYDAVSQEAPLNELYYYNPTVFTSKEPSSYACVERLVCLNPAITIRDQRRNSAKNNSESAVKVNSLGVAVAGPGEDCYMYYCPPYLPAQYGGQQQGDQYTPPPMADNYLLSTATAGAVRPQGFLEESHSTVSLGNSLSGIQRNSLFEKRIQMTEPQPVKEQNRVAAIREVVAPKIRTVQYAKVSVQNPRLVSEVSGERQESVVARAKAATSVGFRSGVSESAIEGKSEVGTANSNSEKTT